MRKKPKLVTLADSIEAAIDQIPAWDHIPYHIRREAAEKAAQTIRDYLKEACDA